MTPQHACCLHVTMLMYMHVSCNMHGIGTFSMNVPCMLHACQKRMACNMHVKKEWVAHKHWECTHANMCRTCM